MAKLDVTLLTRAADRLLETADDPRHRQLLENYRRHALLEVSGRWEEILDPAMTVEHPVYLINEGGRSLVLDGRDQVAGFYRRMTESGAQVIVPAGEEIAVAGWGFASESVFHHHLSGRVLARTGVEVDDPDACYLLRHRIAMVWRFDDHGRLVAEHVYEHAASREVAKLAEEDVITPEEAREALTPLIRPLPAGSPR